jgi:tetratricopeptide (TPR) repeat protein
VTESDVLVSESKVLQSWLRYRLNKDEGGRIEERLLRYGISIQDKAFSYAGVAYPNPLYWSVDQNLNWEGGIRPVLGHLHNDLHVDNILVVRGQGIQRDYLLIDFAMAESMRPLFYDQAYLEFSLLLSNSLAGDVLLWLEELKKLVMVSGPQEIYKSGVDTRRLPAEAIAAMRHICKSWINEKFAPRKAQLYRQQLLARVAVGLNFFNKEGLEISQTLLALMYAAVHLQEYFSFCHIPYPDSTCPLIEKANSAGSPLTDIRSASHFMDSFEPGRGSYLLISSLTEKEILNLNASLFGRVNWSVVLDLDERIGNQNFYETVQPELEKVTLLRLHVPEPGISKLNVSNRSTAWIKARGSESVLGSVSADFDSWRRKRLQPVRNLLAGAFSALQPLSVRVVVLCGESHAEYAASLVEATFETAQLDDVRCLWLGNEPPDLKVSTDELLSVRHEPVAALQDCVALSLGGSTAVHSVLLPTRATDHQGLILEDFTGSRELAILNEDLQLVYASLRENSASPGEFLRGAPITWTELDISQDLMRDPYVSTLEKIKQALSDPRNRLFEVSHKPGAGGTTFAKRLLWDLKEQYPCAELRRYSDHTATRVESLFHLCSLPVLLLVEADVCSREDATRLLRATSARNARCCVLFVSRFTGAAPGIPISDVRTYLGDVMPHTEAKRFLGQYSIGASASQRAHLTNLTFNDGQQKFRSPFFYGLYRFEDGFSHIGEFVHGHLRGLTPKQTRLLALTSLVSVFSQGGMQERLLAAIAEEEYVLGQMLARIFGQDADRLFVCYAKENFLVKASHPLIAQQILETTLNSSRKDASWGAHLSTLAHELIEKFKMHAQVLEPDAIELLMQLFVQRQHLVDSDQRTQFSGLLVEIQDEPYQAEIFRRLTSAWPDEPHFWNHYARHSMYSRTKRLDDAVNYLTTAISLAPDDELHLHTMGMVYSSKVNQTLAQFPKNTGQEVEAWSAVESDYRQARDFFLSAREIAREGGLYPFISDIQLITRTISILRGISAANSWLAFLKQETSIVTLLRQELADANDLLVEVKKLTAETADHPDYVDAVDFYLQRIENSSEALIDYLNTRISKPGGDSLQNRRFLLSVQEQQQQQKRLFKPLPAESLDRYLGIAERNLESAPTDQDFRHWFGLYRDSPRFNATEAIEKCHRWSQTTGSLDSAFFLYVLYFTQWYDGAIRNVDIVAGHLDRCLGLSQERNRRPSLEFLAITPSPGIVPVGRLGNRDPKSGFFTGVSQLGLVEGTVNKVAGPQSGTITVLPKWFRGTPETTLATQSLKAFFVPGEDFHAEADENVFVQFYLGFRRGGLRAHVVKRA